MKRNRVKASLKEDSLVIGTMVTELRTPEVARMLSAAGFDFIVIDAEHSYYSLETVADIVRASKATDLVCLVRVADPEYHIIARTLDAGAQGIIVPRVEDRSIVEKVVSSSRYPPQGRRGYGPRALVRDYQKTSMEELMKRVNEETMVMIQVESGIAVEKVDELTSIKGIDGVLIGPSDLSISLGLSGDFNNPRMVESIEKTIDSCRRHDLACAIHLRDLDLLLKWMNRGVNMPIYSTDVDLLISAATEALRRLKPAS